MCSSVVEWFSVENWCRELVSGARREFKSSSGPSLFFFFSFFFLFRTGHYESHVLFLRLSKVLTFNFKNNIEPCQCEDELTAIMRFTLVFLTHGVGS